MFRSFYLEGLYKHCGQRSAAPLAGSDIKDVCSAVFTISQIKGSWILIWETMVSNTQVITIFTAQDAIPIAQ